MKCYLSNEVYEPLKLEVYFSDVISKKIEDVIAYNQDNLDDLNEWLQYIIY